MNKTGTNLEKNRVRTFRLNKKTEACLEDIMREYGLDNVNQTINFVLEHFGLVLRFLIELKKVAPYDVVKNLEKQFRLLRME